MAAVATTVGPSVVYSILMHCVELVSRFGYDALHSRSAFAVAQGIGLTMSVKEQIVGWSFRLGSQTGLLVVEEALTGKQVVVRSDSER